MGVYVEYICDNDSDGRIAQQFNTSTLISCLARTIFITTFKKTKSLPNNFSYALISTGISPSMHCQDILYSFCKSKYLQNSKSQTKLCTPHTKASLLTPLSSTHHHISVFLQKHIERLCTKKEPKKQKCDVLTSPWLESRDGVFPIVFSHRQSGFGRISVPEPASLVFLN